MRYFNNKVFSRNVGNSLKVIVLSTIVLSLFTAICDALFPHFFGIPGPQAWFSLSYWGLKHLFIWQPFTYFFISSVSGGLSIPFLLYLALNMYFLWTVGSSVIQMKGEKHFLWLYLGGGIFSGLIMATTLLTNYIPMQIAGSTPALYCILTAWMMLIPEVEVLIFFAIPVKVKWLIVGLLGMNFLVDISHGNFLNFLLFLSPVIFGYFYALLVWKIHSPFRFFFRLERFVIQQADKIQKRFYQSSKFDHSFAKNSKIYDFKTGKAILNDEDFVDACLSKIALQGKNSLTFFEKLRMKRISKKRKKQKKSSTTV